jgi:hypothetical protein
MAAAEDTKGKECGRLAAKYSTDRRKNTADETNNDK